MRVTPTLYCFCEEGEETLSEEIRYVDVTSLYRTVHKYLMT